jgi:Nas2 N_terminal domain
MLALADSITVRTTRARIIWLKNDYKDIMNRIEKGLHEHHASMQAAGPPKDESAEVSAAPVAESHSEPIIETPFARVNSVESGSPAHEANLKAGDRIRAFGTANWTNHENLRKLAEVVQRNEGVWNPFHYVKAFLAHFLLATHICQSRTGLTGAPTSSDTTSKLGRKRNSRLSHSTNLRMGYPHIGYQYTIPPTN